MRILDFFKLFIKKRRMNELHDVLYDYAHLNYKIKEILSVYIPDCVVLGISDFTCIHGEDKLKVHCLHSSEHNALVKKEVIFPLEFLDMPIESIKDALTAQM